MTSVVFQNNMQAFGSLTTNMVAALYNVNSTLPRLQAAIANAATGFSGTAGTEYEGNNTLFGIVPDPNNAGAQGEAYASAMVTITNAWDTFWQAASGAINTLDNGNRFIF